jgi:hypothetical protein
VDSQNCIYVFPDPLFSYSVSAPKGGLTFY